MNRKDLLYNFYVKKDYTNLIKTPAESLSSDELELLAKLMVMEQNYDRAFEIYKSLGMEYSMGRIMLLKGNLDSAKDIWLKIKTDSPPVLWGKILIQFIERYVKECPTFFQIRSFLEVDLDALLSAKQYEFCENIINGADIMARNNTECYKFIGRVFVNHNLHDVAKLFLEKAKNVCYVDPEVHFLFAKCYMANNNTHRAVYSLETCLEKAPGYYPALKLLRQLKLG